MRPCCRDETNRIELEVRDATGYNFDGKPVKSGAMRVEQCVECGRKHYVLEAAPGNYDSKISAMH